MKIQRNQPPPDAKDIKVTNELYGFRHLRIRDKLSLECDAVADKRFKLAARTYASRHGWKFTITRKNNTTTVYREA